ncbi:Eco57I restriction-modification methylase domain-containing protein [Paenibacillus sp. PL91]|uniref:Eco57I restriction-modification methylase domain-containing protein n=1 Tax=Paenibacillus sp. PL91 TaxID=2729538 RepID=UPI00145D930E|nr:N-6 DNA methylase [Paenibacillus sp. PL91]MBC9203327.1 N-6 DNA methylase [Paenibacillus sp. PL91]
MNKKCQVFTPNDIVIKLLDIVNYTDNLYGKKIIENACGDGNILKVIVDRYITDCKSQGIANDKIKLGLEEDVYGAEIDEEQYLKCITNLNQVAGKHGLFNVRWKILNVDILKENLQIKFDFIVGNPPYISYKELDTQTRQFVRENFSVCQSGKFDYCYAFLESSLKSLNENGKMSYLIPSSIFKNVFAQNLRNFLMPFINQIYDYQSIKLFDALTSSAIVVCGTGEVLNNTIDYHYEDKGTSLVINKADLFGKWEFKPRIMKTEMTAARFGDYFNASITIATLYNKAFVLDRYQELEDEEYIQVKSSLIEKDILKVAASPRSLHFNKREMIIFPYYYVNGCLHRYSEDDFERIFPRTKEYLKSFLVKLNERDSDKSVNWFEYGRTQALAHLNQEKLLLSTVVTKQIKVYTLSKDCIPYSGIYITKKTDLSLDYAKGILESKDFHEYVKSIGTNANGTSLRITVKDINNYIFTKGRYLNNE